MRRIHPALRALACASVLAVACQDGSTDKLPFSPDANVAASRASSASTPNFVNAASGAPTIANPVIAFWAKKGDASEVFMYYHALPGATDSSDFLRFRVRKKSLVNFPNGQPMAKGDSVLITITLVDPANLIVEFQPSGLTFSASDPAALRLSYLEADHDFNHDGVINGTDSQIERQLKLWRLHPPNPWTPQTSALNRTLDEVETTVPNFTSYAIAY